MELPSGIVVPSVTNKGFILYSTKIFPPKDCKVKNPYLLKFHLLISKLSTNEMPLWENFLKNCSSIFSNEFLAILNYNKAKIKNKKGFLEYLKIYQIEKKKRNGIAEIYDKINKSHNTYESIDSFINFTQKINNSFTGQEIFKYANNQLEILEKSRFEKSYFFKNIYSAALAIKSNNISWARSLIRELLARDIDYVVYDISIKDIPPYKIEDYEKSFNSIIEFICLNLDDKKLSSMLIDYIDQIMWGNPIVDKLRSRLELEKTLTEIRASMRSVNYAKKYIGLSFLTLYSKASGREAKNFVDEIFKERELESFDNSDLWFFRFYIPNAKNKEKLNDKIFKYFKESNDFFKMKMLSTPKIKKVIAAKDKMYAHAYFQLKKKLLEKMMSEARAINFAVYELTKMRSYQDEYLWWLAL